MQNRIKVRLYNTYNLVTPLIDDIIAELNCSHVSIKKVILNKKCYKLADVLVYYIKLLKEEFIRADVKIFFTQPPLNFLFFPILPANRSVLYIMDLYPEMLFVSNIIKENSSLGKKLKYLSVKRLKKFDKIIVIGSCTKEILLKKGIEEQKIKIIRNYSNHNFDKIKEESDKKRVKILYSGNIGRPHHFNTILEAALVLKEFPVQFKFIGDGYRKKEIENYINEKKLKNVEILNKLSYEHYLKEIKSADIHFISLKTEYTGISVPSKFYSAIAAGGMILYEGDPNSELYQFLLNHKSVGRAIEIGDIEKMVEVIENYIPSIKTENLNKSLRAKALKTIKEIIHE